MKIYFAGSIRGGRDDAVVYEAMITWLRSFGEVLTEHVGDPDRISFTRAKEAIAARVTGAAAFSPR